MKRRFIHTLLFFFFSTILSAEIAYGQDSGMPSDNNNYPSSNEEKVVYSPGGEGDPIVTPSKTPLATGKDSASYRQPIRINPVAEPTKVTKQAPADDSVLSFNFLYYIIRKYKLQDIID